MSDYREAVTHCPYCGRRNDRHENPDDATPDDGDLSVCWGCQKIGVFAVGPLGITVRKATAEEAAKYTADPRLRAALGAMTESFDPLTAINLWRGRHRP